MDKSSKKQFVCLYCKLKFSNKGLLNFHVFQKHPNKFVKFKNKTNRKINYKHICEGCHNRFKFISDLKYHIRKAHFNLCTKTTYSDLMEINQVWYEKVANTDLVAEIKKISNNNFLIRRLDKKASMEVNTEMHKEVIDLHAIYPTKSLMKKSKCRVCSKRYARRELRKHFAEKHGDMLKKTCDTCNCTFKRRLYCILHVCPTSKQDN